MRKYENVDVVAFLGAVMQGNTKHYKDDFQHDVEMFERAAESPDGDTNRLVWLSRRNGTECFRERDIYLVESYAYTAWQYHADNQRGGFRAYAVEIDELANGRIMGNLYELDYRQHAAAAQKVALHVETVSVKYADGTALCLPCQKWDKQSRRLYNEHGAITFLRLEPQEEEDFESPLLRHANPLKHKRFKGFVLLFGRPYTPNYTLQPKKQKKAALIRAGFRLS